MIRELSAQPGSGNRPFALHRCCRDADNCGSLIKCKPAEVAQLDDPFLLGVQGSETFESVVQDQHIDIVSGIGRLISDQRDAFPCTTAFVGFPRSCSIDKNPPHNVRSGAIEMRAILPVNAALIDQADISFMNECSRLESMIGAFPSQTLSGELPKLSIHHRQQILECLVSTVIPLDQKLRDFRGFGTTDHSAGIIS